MPTFLSRECFKLSSFIIVRLEFYWHLIYKIYNFKMIKKKKIVKIWTKTLCACPYMFTFASNCVINLSNILTDIFLINISKSRYIINN